MYAKLLNNIYIFLMKAYALAFSHTELGNSKDDPLLHHSQGIVKAGVDGPIMKQSYQP